MTGDVTDTFRDEWPAYQGGSTGCWRRQHRSVYPQVAWRYFASFRVL